MMDWERDDPRNKLWRHYACVLEVVRPNKLPDVDDSNGGEFKLLSADSETDDNTDIAAAKGQTD